MERSLQAGKEREGERVSASSPTRNRNPSNGPMKAISKDTKDARKRDSPDPHTHISAAILALCGDADRRADKPTTTTTMTSRTAKEHTLWIPPSLDCHHLDRPRGGGSAPDHQDIWCGRLQRKSSFGGKRVYKALRCTATTPSAWQQPPHPPLTTYLLVMGIISLALLSVHGSFLG